MNDPGRCGDAEETSDPARSAVELEFQSFHGSCTDEHQMVLYRIVSQGHSVGELVLRIRSTSTERLYDGDVGFRVHPEYRGHGYAEAALLQLMPLASQFGFEELWITCAADNIASRRTLAKAGAAQVETVEAAEGEGEVGSAPPIMRYRLAVKKDFPAG